RPACLRHGKSTMQLPHPHPGEPVKLLLRESISCLDCLFLKGWGETGWLTDCLMGLRMVMRPPLQQLYRTSGRIWQHRKVERHNFHRRPLQSSFTDDTAADDGDAVAGYRDKQDRDK